MSLNVYVALSLVEMYSEICMGINILYMTHLYVHFYKIKSRRSSVYDYTFYALP